jgi:TonB family protein
MDVTDVLRDRMREAPGLQRMATISVLFHAGIAAVVILGSSQWLSRREVHPRAVMTITLGGGEPGVQTGGVNPMGGRPIQTVTPSDPKHPAPVTPPAAKAPEMTVPLPGKTTAKTAPTPAVKQAPDDARGKIPTQGAETVAGSTPVETNVRGQGFGLSTSGGLGTSGVKLDVTFCCPGYLETMIQRIRQNWDPRAETASEVVIKFTIRRDGMIADTTVERSSGYPTLDIAALRAMEGTRQLPMLPAEFPSPTLPVHLTFQYKAR